MVLVLKMKTNFNFKSLRAPLAALTLIVSACGDDGGGGLDDAQPVIDNYAVVVHAAYAEALAKAEDLQDAVDAFVAAPSGTTLEAAKTAWKAAREPYGQTEAFRFYDGPIDGADGPEGEINAWPLDEVYIDTIVDDTAVTLSKAALADRNEQGGEKNIATGYHAIEYLLWGQDTSVSGPGTRPFTDYTTAANAARRGQYLALAAELLVDDLTIVRDAWAPGGDNYGADFKELAAREAVGRMLQGMGGLSGAELSGERMSVAYDNQDQEDEHSCFSDNTHRDLYLNALAVQNVYLGRFGTTDGPGLDVLVAARDAALDARMKSELTASLSAIQAIPTPFDQAIQGVNTAPGRMAVLAAIRALQTQTETIAEIAALLDAPINLE